ncbi:uncharacterized protein (DUF1330 family) [Pontibacter ummariensis]|uniref:Uncharacterized conserved protein, DUF1330 family n=1 Tax=Pontibacter ummariensis TaxID=1610492 RepID=A0A239ESJ8_9BACT|nr:DUF1330 domain-containing protein [Pontibacter ummariensis]PRY12784.1 uncharacterized protein (DUF1330 family) [Pontibacter ummariensis]SNS47228.1 Uncharacterized conserved protein, DUF1330 family [Pontibacter ummariensis]
MPAYVLVQIEVTDPATYEEYKKLTPGSLVPYEGRFVVRGGKTEALEGDWQPSRLVMLEFPSVERAKAWWNSPEYAKAKSMRQQAANTQMLVVEGFEG